MARPKASQSGPVGPLVAEAGKSGYMNKASNTPSPEVLGLCNVIVLDSEDESETTFKPSSSKFGSSRDPIISSFSVLDSKPMLSPSRSSETRKMKDSRKRVLAVEGPSGASMFDTNGFQASPSSIKRSTLGLPWHGNRPHSETMTTPGPAVDLEALEQFASPKRKRKSGVQAVLEMESGTPQLAEQDNKENYGSAVQGGNGGRSDNTSKKRKKEAGNRVDPESSSMRVQMPPDLAAGGGSVPSEGTTMSTCHQCRQRHGSSLAWCRDTSGRRACTQKYCAKCLHNRYGEMVHEVQDRDTWSCPRCRGICNCSMCMKKKGLAPTGGLAKKAKAAGYSSVADLLEKFPNMREERYTREENAAGTTQVKVAIPLKSDPVHQLVDDSEVFQASEVRKKSKQVKQGPGTAESVPPEGDRSTPTEGGKKRRRRKKTEVEASVSHAQGQGSAVEPQKDVAGEGSAKKKKRKSRAKNRLVEDSVKGKVVDDSTVQAYDEEPVEEEIVLPTGAPLLEVGDLGFPPEAIGPALQILEFCSAFEKPLKLKRVKGQKILSEMLRGGTLRRGGQSDAVHLHAQLLSIILDDVDDDTTVAMSAASKNCWVYHLGRHLTEQFCVSKKEAEQGAEEEGDDRSYIASTSGTKSLPLPLWPVSSEDIMVVLRALKSGVDGYGNLSITTRLQLLATLCDDTLSTKKMRTHLEKVTSNHEVEQKENREGLLAVKKQAKEEVAGKARAKRDNVSPQHDAGVKGDHSELAEKEAQLTETAAKLCAPRCDALRTEPEAVHKSGSRFWRLKGVQDRGVVVLQDISNLKSGVPNEAWSGFSEDQQEVVLQCITNLNTRYALQILSFLPRTQKFI